MRERVISMKWICRWPVVHLLTPLSCISLSINTQPSVPAIFPWMDFTWITVIASGWATIMILGVSVPMNTIIQPLEQSDCISGCTFVTNQGETWNYNLISIMDSITHTGWIRVKSFRWHFEPSINNFYTLNRFGDVTAFDALALQHPSTRLHSQHTFRVKKKLQKFQCVWLDIAKCAVL